MTMEENKIKKNLGSANNAHAVCLLSYMVCSEANCKHGIVRTVLAGFKEAPSATESPRPKSSPKTKAKPKAKRAPK